MIDLAVIPLYQNLESPLWRPLLDGLDQTYGPETFGPGGAAGLFARQTPALAQALRPAPAYGMERLASDWLAAVAPLLPGPPPDLYLAALLFSAPAATIDVGGRPAIVLGLERFHPDAPSTEPKYWYRPQEAEEMIPHEAAHAARMEALALPPTPRRLSLLEMVMLEGTALTFTDLLLGRETLATFMPAGALAWHRQNDQAVRQAAAAEFDQTGMDVFERYFSAGSPISGYYAGYSFCREYLERYGPGSMRRLIGLPSRQILAELA